MTMGDVKSERRRLLKGLASLSVLLLPMPALAAVPAAPIKVRMSVDESPIVPLLAERLGFFSQEGLEIERVRIEDYAPNDFEMQRPMHDGQIDVAYHWFNHAVFGARHGLPITAVMVFNDAPGMTILVDAAKLVAIRSPADFRNRSIAAGAGYGTKALLTHTIACRYRVCSGDYRLVATESVGRQERILAGLADHSVDLVTAEEPMTGTLRASGLAVPLIDLTSRINTVRALGAPWPAQSLLMAPGFLRQRPRAAQKVVNAFVRTMRWIETHSAEDIAAHLPAGYFRDGERDAQIAQIRASLNSFARRDYRVPPAGARLVVDAIASYRFDGSTSGLWRAGASVDRVDPSTTYDNRLVRKAMKAIS